MVRRATFRLGVSGAYAPPANLKEHFLHSQIPVPLRFTETVSQRGQVCTALVMTSISRTLFRINRPYRGPNRPVEPEILPFAFILPFAISCTSVDVLYMLLGTHLYLLNDPGLGFAFADLVYQIIELVLYTGRDGYDTYP